MDNRPGSRILLTLIVVVLLTMLAPVICTAQVVLKPHGQDAVSLRVKALAADVVIDGQFAATNLTLLFQNETSDRIEADFLYTLPPDTLVAAVRRR
jgi:Na+-transporting NADH:ubiquinone oxidoreductase subunit NqrC